MKTLSFLCRKGIWAFFSFSFLCTILLGMAYLYLDSQLPSVESLRTVKLQIPLRVYTQDGKLIQEFGEKRRLPVTYKDIPKPLINAVLVTEDQRFFDHVGVDVIGLARAGLRMIQTGTKSQGGSTITMQVARNFFLSRKKTFLRKFKEILLAIKIERELPKETILELYLNKIYLGNRAYGIGAAAQIYYGKSIKDLTLAEMAMIAGLPQAPSTQNPIINPEAAKKRRNHVLLRMLEAKFITDAEYQKAIHEPIKTYYHGANIEVHAPYVAEMIRQSLYQHFGKSAYTHGYKVYTTIHSSFQSTANRAVLNRLIDYDRRHGYRGAVAKIQPHRSKNQSIHAVLSRYAIIDALTPALVTTVQKRRFEVETAQGTRLTIPYEGFQWARRALNRGWYGPSIHDAHQVVAAGDVVYIRQVEEDEWELAQMPVVEAALVSMNPHDGAISALVGGLDFATSKFNRATQSLRQPGSSFKPFIYAAALAKGYTLATLINDAPIVVYDPSQPNSEYRPHNTHHTFDGPTRIKEALIRSKNLVSLRILDDIGIDYAIDFVQRFGFAKSALPKGLSLALGSLSVSPLDLTTAYAVFANGGFKVQPYLIDTITNDAGKVLLKAKPQLACEHCVQQVGQTVAPRVLNEDLTFLMQTALKGVIQEGTARAALSLNREDIGGKTGTTNDQVDAWFAGFHPDLVTTVWVGFDNPRSLHAYGADIALPMWIDYMKVALTSLAHKPFTPPANVVTLPIDKKTGLLSSVNRLNTIMEFFQKDAPPESSGMTQDYYSANEQLKQGNETDLF